VIDNRIKIHILFKFTEAPWGGGNQFLKALREYLRKTQVYSERPLDADVILFNSYPFDSEHLFDSAIQLKKSSDKILVHRIDGPVYHIRGRDRDVDKIIFKFNNLFADGTIFQSKWSREKNYEAGMRKAPYETIIMNAPDPNIFNRKGKRQFNDNKVKLVATSWSGNIRRGFEIYQYLDEHLNFNRYEMTFVGNSPIEFKNIKWIKPVPSRELAGILKEHDIYITASRNDPCSNALIEALHCGLPVVARNDGGHPEIVGEAGAFFDDENSVIEAVERVAQNYVHYQAKINLPNLDEIGQRYYEFALGIYKGFSNGKYHPWTAHFYNIMRFRTSLTSLKAKNRLQGIIAGLKHRSRIGLP
jgi:glycosyltransferase involved in cell wall biosynthesis